jgi:type VI secretion system secreted protein VgrG
MSLPFNPVSLITGIFEAGSGAAAKKAPFELRAGPYKSYELEVISFRGRERVNDVYRYEVTIATEVAQTALQDGVFGAPACLMVKSQGYGPQVIQGLVASLEALGGVSAEQGADYRRYRLEIVPTLWLLKHRSSTQIFQGKTVMQIVKALLEVVGIKESECKWRTVDKEYPPLPFMYQRNESDYEFFRRVLASAGIFFYFDHATEWLESLSSGGGKAGATVLNFARRPSDTPGVTGPSGKGGASSSDDSPSGTFQFDDGMGADDASERVFEFGLKKRLRTKALQLLERRVAESNNWIDLASEPTKSAEGFAADATSVKAKVLVQARYQVDPNLTETTQDPKSIDNPQMELELARTRRRFLEARGASDCRRMAAGYRFKLASHPVLVLNGEYTLTAVEAEGNNPDFVANAPFVYRNRFRCIPSAYMPIPPRPKKRPKLGLEVAQVVAYKDILKVPWLESSPCGYVKIRFRWAVLDVHGTPAGELKMGTDDADAIWVPVVQPWAGAGYGAQFIPREGMEVLVGFLEHQGERPVILGCLYSAANAPPWSDKSEQLKVGIKSQTRAANAGYSEISIDDTQGKELLTLMAQTDLLERVNNDLTVSVGNNRSFTVAQNEHVKIHGNRTNDIDGDHSETIKGSHGLLVGGNATSTIGGGTGLTVAGNHTLSVAGDSKEQIGGLERRTIGGSAYLTVGRTHTVAISGQATTVIGTKDNPSQRYTTVWGPDILSATGQVLVQSPAGIVLECGTSTITLNPGSIRIAADTILIDGQQSTSLFGAGPSLHLTDSVSMASNAIALAAQGASLKLGSSQASLLGSQVSLGSNSGSSSSSSTSSSVVTKPFVMTLCDASFTPYANLPYDLTVGGQQFQGTTDGQGVVTQQVSPTATTAELTLWLTPAPTGQNRRYLVSILDQLPPPTDVAGAQTRLKNLGYYHGDPDGAVTPALDEAVKEFQGDNQLPQSGELDGPTAAALAKVHGH